MPSFCRNNHKIPPFLGGGGVFRALGGGSADFIFMGAGIFLIPSSVRFRFFRSERLRVKRWEIPAAAHEDGNGEKLTVKKWWLFGCRFFHGLRRVFHGL